MNSTRKIKKFVSATLVAVSALCASAANATLFLTLTDNVTLATITIQDNQIGDAFSSAGSIGYFGGIGSWIAAITIGGSNAPGTASAAFLDFSSIYLTNNGAGSLTLTLTDTGFTNPSGLNTGVSAGIGGTTNGTVTATSLFNGNTLINLGSFTGGQGGSFSGGGGTSVNTTNPFSLSNSVTVAYGAGGGASTFAMNTNVPEPATLGLLGLGLIGIGLARRKTAQKQTAKS